MESYVKIFDGVAMLWIILNMSMNFISVYHTHNYTAEYYFKDIKNNGLKIFHIVLFIPIVPSILLETILCRYVLAPAGKAAFYIFNIRLTEGQNKNTRVD